jgi:beta-glucosidase
MQILRGELGFSGFVSSGWGANASILSLDSGLDVEAAGGAGPGGGGYLSPAAIRAALANGSLRTATVDRAAGAVLAQMDRFGLLGRARAAAPPRLPAAADEQVVRQTAADSATLLKNTHHALPLTVGDLSSLALIGPGAAQDIAGGTWPGGWNGGGIPSRQVGAYQALRTDLAGQPGVHIRYAPGMDLAGVPVPASALSHGGQPGLLRTTAAPRPRLLAPAAPRRPASPSPPGRPAVPGGGHGSAASSGQAQVVPDLNNTVAARDPLPAGSAHTWTGDLTVPEGGSYRISLGLLGAVGSLALDGTTVARTQPPSPLAQPAVSQAGSRAPRPGITAPMANAVLPAPGGLDNLTAQLTLAPGTHTLSVTELPDASGRPVQVRLGWVTPGAQQASRDAAVSAARRAKAAVVFAWSTPAAGGALPAHQDELIRDVAAVNPDTIVVLNTPGPVALPWLPAVRAVAELWYPGDAGGYAAAGVLLGRVNPAGRLPLAWPALSRNAGGAGQVFSFGYGLSYTRFRYSGLTVSPARGGLTVRFRVTNTGRVTGDEVPQVYLGAPSRPPAGVTFAARTLAAYTRITLRPGQGRLVTLRVPRRPFEYWDEARGWVMAAGQRPLYVGSSQQASVLRAAAPVPG